METAEEAKADLVDLEHIDWKEVRGDIARELQKARQRVRDLENSERIAVAKLDEASLGTQRKLG